MLRQSDYPFGRISGTKIPLSWCGCPMVELGQGKYPYECSAQEFRPNAIIYITGCEHSHNTWLPVGGYRRKESAHDLRDAPPPVA